MTEFVITVNRGSVIFENTESYFLLASVIKPRFSIRKFYGEKIGVNLTGIVKVLDLFQSPSNHLRCRMATARLMIFLRPSLVR